MPHVRARDGTQLYVRDWGTGRPVVLVHGWPLDGGMWEYQAVPLVEAGFRVIAYDRRGFGRSDQPATGYDYDTLADDVAHVIDAAGLDRPALVGFSMGGGEVARYLGRHGAAGVSHAALISSVVPGLAKSDANPHGLPREAAEGIIAGLKKDRPGFLTEFMKVFTGAGLISKPVGQPALDSILTVAMQASPIATIECVRAFAGTDFTADLAAFTCPTLIVHGTADKTVPIEPTARRVAAHVPHAQLSEYDGAPHALTITEGPRLAEELIAFLRR